MLNGACCILFLASLAIPAQAVVLRHDLAPQGYEALADQEPFDGMAGVTGGSGLGTSTGSGVLLNGEWLLTAAHVVWEQPLASLRVQWGGQFRGVQAASFPPGWVADPAVGLTQGADLALLRLARPLGFSHEVSIATGDLLGGVAVMLGMGRSGNGLIGAFQEGRELAAMNVIDRQLQLMRGGLLVTDFDGGRDSQNSLASATVDRRYYDEGFEKPLLSNILLEGGGTSGAGFGGLPLASHWFPGLPAEFLEGTSARGDSGGPWFVRNGSGAWHLAGITSWGVNPLLPEGFARNDSRYGDLSFATDVSRHRDWIANTIPEPGWGFFAVAAIAVLRRRRRAFAA